MSLKSIVSIVLLALSLSLPSPRSHNSFLLLLILLFVFHSSTPYIHSHDLLETAFYICVRDNERVLLSFSFFLLETILI